MFYIDTIIKWCKAVQPYSGQMITLMPYFGVKQSRIIKNLFANTKNLLMITRILLQESNIAIERRSCTFYWQSCKSLQVPEFLEHQHFKKLDKLAENKEETLYCLEKKHRKQSKSSFSIKEQIRISRLIRQTLAPLCVSDAI